MRHRCWCLVTWRVYRAHHTLLFSLQLGLPPTMDGVPGNWETDTGWKRVSTSTALLTTGKFPKSELRKDKWPFFTSAEICTSPSRPSFSYLTEILFVSHFSVINISKIMPARFRDLIHVTCYGLKNYAKIDRWIEKHRYSYRKQRVKIESVLFLLHYQHCTPTNVEALLPCWSRCN